MEPAADGPRLGPEARAAGHRLAAFREVGSTNTVAMERGRAGDPGALWVYAEAQTAGRGRRGRAWSTVAGNMAASHLVVLDVTPAAAATLGFVAGLALDEALRGLLPAEVARDLALKWPNDLLVGDAKLSGILLEAEPRAAGGLAVVIGIGVNVTSAPEGTPYPATSLAALGVATTAAEVFARIAEAWAVWIRVWDAGHGMDRVRRAWMNRARGLGRTVTIRFGERLVEGRFEGIDAEGRLMLVGRDGTRRTIAAGDVHFGDAASVPVDRGVGSL